MSDNEAIKALIAHRIRFTDDFGWDKSTIEALDIAIASLATESKPVVRGEWRENKYREQVEFDIKAALNALNCNSNQMPYHIYSMLYGQISAIGYTPITARMREEDDEQ
jgi:hypothetical protein